MLAIVIDRLMCSHRSRGRDYVCTRVRIPIEPREVAARKVQTDPVPCLEDIRGGPQVDRVLVNFPGYNFRRALSAFSITSPHYAVGEKTRVTTLIDVNQKRGEISVDSRSRSIELK